MKVVYTGLESSGKSLQLARVVRGLVIRNSKWYAKTGIERPIRSSMSINPSFVEYAKSLHVPIIFWRNLDEIIYHTECDVIIDELLKYFDARAWLSLSIDAKHWLTQGAKTGVHMYASAQDFSQVEKSLRIICTEVYVVSKLCGSKRPMKTRPSAKRIWGICLVRQVDPKSFRGDNASMETLSMIPSFFAIRKEDCDIFDTNAIVLQSNLPTLRKRYQMVEYMKDGTVVKQSEQYV